MPANQVLLIAREPSVVMDVRRELSALGSWQFVVAEEADAAIKEATSNDFDIIVVHLDADFDRLSVVPLLRAGHAPVLLLCEEYDIEEATALFRLGVGDYLSRCDHLSKLACVITELIRANRGGVPARTAVVRSASRRTRTSTRVS